MSRLALTGWCFGLVLALLWMFLLGLFVGKGITPANINLTEIKKRMVAEGIWPGSGKTVQQEEPSRTTNTKEKIPLNDLEFYEKLAKKKQSRLQKPTVVKTPPKKKSDTVTAPNLASSAQPSTKSREQQRPSAGSFTIQLASFKDVASAKKFAAGFKDLKPPPTVRQVELPGKGRWYRVQVGQFASRDEATALADRLAKKYQIQVFVVTLGG
jgi:cell division septation protein DedD